MCEHEFESQNIVCPDCGGNGRRHLHAMGPEQCITCHGRGNISGKPIHKLITNLETALIDNLYNQLAAAKAELAAEIAKKDRMIEMACDRLSNYRKCPPEVCDLPYHPGDIECCKHWRKWLGKAALEGKP